MRVFITGASGHIGSALVPELLSAGHGVVGLARSDASAAALTAAGAVVRRGDLDDVRGLAEASAAADLRAVEAIGAALEGSGKPFVITSGTLLLARAAPGRIGTEEDRLDGG